MAFEMFHGELKSLTLNQPNTGLWYFSLYLQFKTVALFYSVIFICVGTRNCELKVRKVLGVATQGNSCGLCQ